MERKTDRGSEKPGFQVDFEVPYFQIHPLLGGFHSHGVPFALDGFYKGKSQSKTDDVSRATPTTKRKPPFSGSRQSVRICKVEFLSFSGCVNRENKPSATPNITGEKSWKSDKFLLQSLQSPPFWLTKPIGQSTDWSSLGWNLSGPVIRFEGTSTARTSRNGFLTVPEVHFLIWLVVWLPFFIFPLILGF